MADKIKLNSFLSNEILEFVTGHFPEKIIIPGAVLLEVIDRAVSDYLQSKLNTSYKLRHIQQAIFYSALNNLSNADFIFNINQQSEKVLEVDGVIKTNDIKIVNVKMIYKNE